MSGLKHAVLSVVVVLIAGACGGAANDPVPPEPTGPTTTTPAATSTLAVTSITEVEPPASSTTSSTTVAPTSSALTEFLITTYDMLADRLEDQANPDLAGDPGLRLARLEQFHEEWLALSPPPEARAMFLESITAWSLLLSGYQGWVANTEDAGDDETFLRLSLNEFQRVLNNFARDLALVQVEQSELTISVLRERVDDSAAIYTVQALTLEIASTDATNRILAAMGAVNSLADQDAVRVELADAVEDFAAFADSWRALDVPPHLADLNRRTVTGIDLTASLYREMLATMDTDPDALEIVLGFLQVEGRASQRLAIDRLRSVADVLRSPLG